MSRQWMRLAPGQSLALDLDEVPAARKIAHYWQKKAKRPRALFVKRCGKGFYRIERLITDPNTRTVVGATQENCSANQVSDEGRTGTAHPRPALDGRDGSDQHTEAIVGPA